MRKETWKRGQGTPAVMVRGGRRGQERGQLRALVGAGRPGGSGTGPPRARREVFGSASAGSAHRPFPSRGEAGSPGAHLGGSLRRSPSARADELVLGYNVTEQPKLRRWRHEKE